MKNWLITGAGRGFGHAFAQAALERGDRVAATVRRAGALDDLVAAYGDRVLPLVVDVTDPDAVRDAVTSALAHLGRLDVVVNNAGYGHFGAVEELSEQDLRDQLETNVFGPLRVTQAVLPAFREQGHGHVVQVSSIGGVGAFANLGAYHASKWALEALSESLASEVAELGVRVTLLEPGGYATDWAGSSARHSAPLAAYDHVREAAATRRGGHSPGDPRAAAAALLEVVDHPAPPLRLLLGATAHDVVRGVYEQRLGEWSAWEQTSRTAQGG
jgi:NAD(P)-dependent dehydrogenase (short-subunit alcohol dehydrogenase family)